MLNHILHLWQHHGFVAEDSKSDVLKISKIFFNLSYSFCTWNYSAKMNNQEQISLLKHDAECLVHISAACGKV